MQKVSFFQAVVLYEKKANKQVKNIVKLDYFQSYVYFTPSY